MQASFICKYYLPIKKPFWGLWMSKKQVLNCATCTIFEANFLHLYKLHKFVNFSSFFPDFSLIFHNLGDNGSKKKKAMPGTAWLIFVGSALCSGVTPQQGSRAIATGSAQVTDKVYIGKHSPIKCTNSFIHFFFDTGGTKKKFPKRNAKRGNFARCDGRPTPHGVGSVPPFEKVGRKLCAICQR